MKSKGIAFGFDKHLEGIPFGNLKEIDRIVEIPSDICITAVLGCGPRKEHRPPSSHVHFTSTTIQLYRRDSAVIGCGPRKGHRPPPSHMHFTSTTTQLYENDAAVIGCGPRKGHRPPLFPHALHKHKTTLQAQHGRNGVRTSPRGHSPTPTPQRTS